MSNTFCHTCHSEQIPNMNHPNDPGTPQTCHTCHTAKHFEPWLDLPTTCGVCHNGTVASVKDTLTLTAYATGLHGSPLNPGLNVAYASGSNMMLVNATGSTTCATPAYDWNWGDGNAPHGSGQTATYTYSSVGDKMITLTVTCGTATAQKAKIFTAVAADAAPVATAGVSWDNNTWTVTLSDNSTDDNGLVQVVAYWGDGSNTVIKKPNTAPVGSPDNSVNLGHANVAHAYKSKGMAAYKVTLKVTDTAGNVAQRTYTDPVAFGYFTIAGTVATTSGSGPGIPSATVTLKNSLGKAVAIAYTSTKAGQVGSFSFTKLTPGRYTITVTKSGYTFTTDPDLTKIVGGNKTGFVIAPDNM
jgi:hypothetical protein